MTIFADLNKLCFRKNNLLLDGVREHLRSTIEEQMNAAAEGVY
jgi:hypothetical protein